MELGDPLDDENEDEDNVQLGDPLDDDPIGDDVQLGAPVGGDEQLAETMRSFINSLNPSTNTCDPLTISVHHLYP